MVSVGASEFGGCTYADGVAVCGFVQLPQAPDDDRADGGERVRSGLNSDMCWAVGVCVECRARRRILTACLCAIRRFVAGGGLKRR